MRAVLAQATAVGLVLALERSMLALKRQQNLDLQRRILDNLNSAILMFDHGLRLSYLNPAAERLLAGSARQLLGHKAGELFLNAGPIEQMLTAALDSDDSVTRRELELELMHSNRATVDVTVTPVLEGTAGSEVLVELIELDRFLRITRDESLYSQQVVTRELVRGLAHEVKNPLGGLRGAAQLLAKQLDNADLQEYTDVIISEADRLQSLVNRMLGPSTRHALRNTNIHEVLERVRSLVSAEVGGRIMLRRDYDPSIPEMQVDREQLIQALLNVVRNAAQAIPAEGEIVLRTRVLRKCFVGSKRHPLVARIEIIDDGPGIPKEIQDRIFYPMVTGRAEGTGLGLSIAQNLLQQHDGLIECTSAPGHTVFTLLIPIQREQ